jgi:hypothetical protein
MLGMFNLNFWSTTTEANDVDNESSDKRKQDTLGPSLTPSRPSPLRKREKRHVPAAKPSDPPLDCSAVPEPPQTTRLHAATPSHVASVLKGVARGPDGSKNGTTNAAFLGDLKETLQRQRNYPMRSLEDVLAERMILSKGLQYRSDFPSGTYNTFDDLFLAFGGFARPLGITPTSAFASLTRMAKRA